VLASNFRGCFPKRKKGHARFKEIKGATT